MTKSSRILIVEDESCIRNSLQCLLADDGFLVDTASCANDAMAHLTKNSTDLCLTDIYLPDHDLAEWVPQAAQLHPNIQWILYTSAIDYSPPKELLEIGIKKEHFLYKPSLSLAKLKELLISL